MNFAGFQIDFPNFGHFRLDGGAMFGSVPKNIWNQRIPADEENCIRLATRSLLLRAGQRVFLVDVGLGDKWNDKLARIFAIKNNPRNDWGFDPAEVTDVVLTHLHFDHAGGISRFEGTDLKLCFPQATVHLQKANWDNALHPGPREKASYLPENVQILKQAKLNLLEGSAEIFPGLFVHRVDGHTVGQQYIEIRDENSSILYPTDLIPTAHHLPIPFNMGYDICAQTVLEEKEAFLKDGLRRDSIVVFQHDADTPAVRLAIDERGHYCAKEKIQIG